MQIAHHARPALALAAIALALLASAGPAQAQVVNPADKSKSSAEDMQSNTERRKEREGRVTRVPSYDQLPVKEPPPGGLEEEEEIGAYGQPRWTAHRRFPTTRVYVRPQGFFELEYWLRPKVPRNGGPTDTETQFEAEMGLGYRTQLDVYLNFEKTGHDDHFELAGQSVEVRHALADWDVIPMNPTLYVEYAAEAGGPDVLELKLLLGGELTTRWHYGINLVFERELSGELSNEYQVTSGLSYTILDTEFSAGAEVKASFTDTKEDRGDLTENVRAGPSIQWRPHPAMHIDIAMLIGIGGHSNALEPFIVVGWEF
jgi:hypothetical protein